MPGYEGIADNEVAVFYPQSTGQWFKYFYILATHEVMKCWNICSLLQIPELFEKISRDNLFSRRESMNHTPRPLFTPKSERLCSLCGLKIL